MTHSSSKSFIYLACLSGVLTLLGCSSDENKNPVVDPAPEFSDPGEYGCEGCPDGEFQVFENSTELSSQLFSGIIDGSVGNGEFYIESEDGTAIAGPISTDDSGGFTFNTPLFCGTQLVKCIWSNDEGSYVLVTEVTRENCIEPDIRVTLSWDDKARDLDLHFLPPGGVYRSSDDCNFVTCDSDSGPNWGDLESSEDDPRKDVDDTGDFGPENIFLANPAPGRYRVMVHHFGGGEAQNRGQIILNIDGETKIVETSNLASDAIWDVGVIEWPSGEFVESGEHGDCSVEGFCDALEE